MKTNVQKVPYIETCKGTMDWWSWDEICDECGEVIEHFGDWKHSEKPDETRKDFCITCLRKKLDKEE